MVMGIIRDGVGKGNFGLLSPEPESIPSIRDYISICLGIECTLKILFFQR